MLELNYEKKQMAKGWRPRSSVSKKFFDNTKKTTLRTEVE